MFDLPAITWTLTIVLLLSGCYYLLQAIRSHQLTHRVNNGLSAVMNVVMASMLWHLGPTTMLAQIAVLTGATLWFVLQTVARPELKTLCPSTQGRLKCAYHSLAMAGAALMVAMMMGHVTGAVSQPHASAATSHHTMGAAAALDNSPLLAIALTTFFGTAALVFVVLLLRMRLSKTSRRNAGARRRSVRAEHGFEALGAAVMAVMFASMA